MFYWDSLRTELRVKISGSLLPESPKEDHHLNSAFLLPDAFHESSAISLMTTVFCLTQSNSFLDMKVGETTVREIFLMK